SSKSKIGNELVPVKKLRKYVTEQVDQKLILLVERRYPLSRFTLEQMLNVVRLQVEEQNEMSMKLIRALESINETSTQKVAKRRRLNQEDKDVEEIKQHLEIMPDEDDDVYTEATSLARKVPVMDYQIVLLNNKPQYKIIKAVKRQTAGPSNTAVSPTYENSSFQDASTSSHDPDMPALEDFTYSDDEAIVGVEADINNLESSIPTRSMVRAVKDQGGLSQMFDKDFHTCMFACFLSQEEPKRIHQALKDPSWIEVMQEELLQFKMQKVWILVDLPYGKRAISTKWVSRNKKDERGTVIRNKARLVSQGHTQEEGIDYEEVLAPVARIEAIRLFLAYASFIGFLVYQIDVKSVFLYDTIEEEVYVYQPSGFEDLIILAKYTRWSRHFMDYIKLLELGMKLWLTIF
nr:putative ribonuclease H-like domain-containing protein [Tanacetum cinerariifolium]